MSAKFGRGPGGFDIKAGKLRRSKVRPKLGWFE
jgi:hypothetical protein